MPKDIWNLKCCENNEICVPLAAYFSMHRIAEGISAFSTPYEDDEEDQPLSEDTVSKL